jgi:hypothetical protein
MKNVLKGEVMISRCNEAMCYYGCSLEGIYGEPAEDAEFGMEFGTDGWNIVDMTWGNAALYFR